MTGCTTTQVDTLRQCSWDQLAIFGWVMYSDVNCTDDTDEGIRKKQDGLEKIIGKGKTPDPSVDAPTPKEQ